MLVRMGPPAVNVYAFAILYTFMLAW